MTTQMIDTQLQNELDLVISETLPGLAFSYFNLLSRWRNLGNISEFENHTNADFQKFDEEFRLDVYSGKVPDMWHIGYDLDGNNIYEKARPNPVTIIN